MKSSKVKALGKMNGIFAEIIAARGKKKQAAHDESKEDPKEEVGESKKEEDSEDMDEMKANHKKK